MRKTQLVFPILQRRAGGQLWLLLGGVSGTGTYAAAQMATRMTVGLTSATTGKHSRVFWSVVSGHVPESAAAHNKRLRDLNEKIVSGPHIWPA